VTDTADRDVLCEPFRDPAPGEASTEIVGLAADASAGKLALDWTDHGRLTSSLTKAGVSVIRVASDSNRLDEDEGQGVPTRIVEDRLPLPLPDDSIDLIVLEADPHIRDETVTRSEIRSKLDEARRLLRADGQIVVSSRSRLRDGARGWFSIGPRQLTQELAQRGFGAIRHFGVQPRVGAPFRLASLASREGLRSLYSQSGHSALGSRMTNALGRSPLASHVVARRLTVASRHAPHSALETAIASKLRSVATLHWVAWSNPGQAIVRVDAEGSDYFVRLALDSVGEARIARNAAAIVEIHSAIDEAQSPLVPNLVWKGSLLGRSATIESALPGHPLDTFGIRRPTQEISVQRDAFLGALTRIDSQAPGGNREWMERWLTEVRGKLEGILDELRLRKLCDYLGSAPDMERMQLGWVHGDFSPRNLLIDGRGGRATGVIDWDLSHSCAPSFVDSIHWTVRCQAWTAGRYPQRLLGRLETLQKRRLIEAGPRPSPNGWHDSLWAHLVYGLWYNLNLADLHGASRLRLAARLAEFIPTGSGAGR
jgi:aminoglycoside phosphotransferase (APT) family kinase protein/SAM-dependent methyltransferase